MKMIPKVAPLIVALLIAGGIACTPADADSSQQHDALEEYAACLSEPTSDLYVPAGRPSYEQVLVELEAEILSGEYTLEEIESALILFCRD